MNAPNRIGCVRYVVVTCACVGAFVLGGCSDDAGTSDGSGGTASAGTKHSAAGNGGAAPRPAGSGGGTSDIAFDSNDRRGGDEHTEAIDSAAAPLLKPTLLVNTLVGGPGDQFIRSVEFGADGEIMGKGKGFEVRYDAGASSGVVSGDPNTVDSDKFAGNGKPSRIGNKLTDPRNGQTYEIGYRQVAGVLQQPTLVSSAGWQWWNWTEEQAGDLRADSRGYDLSLTPNGQFLAIAWTDGGNSTLTRDPQDLSKELEATKGSLMASAAGLATLYLLVNPAVGRPVSGTFLYTTSMNRAIDRYGRVYLTDKIGKNTTPTNPFEQPAGAGAGLAVLRPDLKQLELNVVLGAACADGAKSTLASVAVRDNILVLGGTSCTSPIASSENAVQQQPGGGQDGYLVVIRLWD